MNNHLSLPCVKRRFLRYLTISGFRGGAKGTHPLLTILSKIKSVCTVGTCPVNPFLHCLDLLLLTSLLVFRHLLVTKEAQLGLMKTDGR